MRTKPKRREAMQSQTESRRAYPPKLIRCDEETYKVGIYRISRSRSYHKKEYMKIDSFLDPFLNSFIYSCMERSVFDY